jgi:predicted dehydrogenase
MVRVGIIGAGFVGRNHFNQYERMKGRAPVIALCDKEADRRAGDWSKVMGNLADARGTKRDLSGIKPYLDWRELLADPIVDLVDICAPTFLHHDIAVAALTAGKHVLCEKPMGLTVAECDEMLAVAGKSKGRFMIAQCVRFWPEYVYLKEAVDDERFGRLHSLELRRTAGLPDHSLGNWVIQPELSGGALLDLHVHDVDFTLCLFGKPASVMAQGYERPGGGMDRIHAQWVYDERSARGRGTRPPEVVQLMGAWDLPSGHPFNMGFTAVFEQAVVFFDMNPSMPLTVLRHGERPERPELIAKEAYFAEIEHLIECIEQGRDPTVTTPAESRDAVALALAEKESALSGRAVEVA